MKNSILKYITNSKNWWVLKMKTWKIQYNAQTKKLLCLYSIFIKIKKMRTKKSKKMNSKFKIQKNKYLTLNLQRTCKIKSIWKKKENKKRNKKAC
jgi:hypothetical protein